ncbi:MAG: hypothetical protein SFV22_14790, partial [Saprospiraceae bacterium]|nr:hypothetical protein [Saprospiraceae bacterium]
MRRTAIYPVVDKSEIKRRLLAWSQTYPVALYLDSNDHIDAYSSWDCLVATGTADTVECNAGSAFTALREFWTAKRDWCFGFLAYDLKNEVENLRTRHSDPVGFPDLYFFQPECVVGIRRGLLEIHTLSQDPAEVLKSLEGVLPVPP